MWCSGIVTEMDRVVAVVQTRSPSQKLPHTASMAKKKKNLNVKENLLTMDYTLPIGPMTLAETFKRFV